MEGKDRADLAPGGGGGCLQGGAREQGNPGPERLSNVPKFTLIWSWTSAEAWFHSPRP